MFEKIYKTFLSGLFLLLPLMITLGLIMYIVNFVGRFTSPLVMLIFGKNYTGVGFIFGVLIILGIGTFSNQYVVKKFFHWLEVVINKIPVVKTIYSSIRDIGKMFDKDKSSSFKKAVLVDYPLKGSKCIGFITNDECIFDGKLSKTAVFVPTTPNPTSGFLLYVDKKDITFIDLPVEDAIKMVVSLGVYSSKK
ncbi:DUF502 domain-containing protein [Helicovermis profundi]|uniref:DUF502 domain-containing protein n=1 Tax=Helicovermis profundi TaxID=3065157 RepID=A0AAU9EAH7_9FIRM|nr:DUF502 domain-containing protein [Clostridia bacterium S502]